MSTPETTSAASSVASPVAAAGDAVDGAQSAVGSRRGKAPVIAGGALAAALAIAGGAYAVTGGLSGPQPDEVLPAQTIGLVKVDLNPSLGQKISAFRWFNSLPKTKSALTNEQDWRGAVVDQAVQGKGGSAKVDYDADIKPWLGDRLAVGLVQVTQGQAPVPVAAIQVTDEAKARDGIRKLAGGVLNADLSFKDGYALLTSSGQGPTINAMAAASPLAKNATYSGDLGAIGEQGVLSGWLDYGALAKADLSGVAQRIGSNSSATVDPTLWRPGGAGSAQLAGLGRIAFGLRFDSSYAELAGVNRGNTSTQVAGASIDLSHLPADTVGAVGTVGLADYIGGNWASFLKAVDSAPMKDGRTFSEQLPELEQSLGVTLPDDLQTMVGNSTALVLGPFNADGSPRVGLLSSTDASGAKAISETLRTKFAEQQGNPTASLGFVGAAKGNVFALAADTSYADQLVAGGNLGGSAAFQSAVGTDPGAAVEGFVDLDRLEPRFLSQVPAGQRDAVKALQAVGLRMGPLTDGSRDFRIRLVAN